MSKTFTQKLIEIIDTAKQTSKDFDEYPSSAEWDANTLRTTQAIIDLLEQTVYSSATETARKHTLPLMGPYKAAKITRDDIVKAIKS